MAAKAASQQTVVEEVDFFGIEKMKMNLSCKPPKPRLDRPLSIRGLQTAISKIDPEVIKNLIASGPSSSSTPPSTPAAGASAGSASGDLITTLPTPLYNSMKHFEISEQVGTTTTTIPSSSPMTIFYNGKVAVFDVPRAEAENILKLAVTADKVEMSEKIAATPTSAAGYVKINNATSEDYLQPGGVPQKRRKSLERFFDKRKERLISVWPYDNNFKGK